ncbi:MAG: AAA family ATPase [Thermodesulfobacteriota bacterium]
MLVQCDKCQTRYRFNPPADAPERVKLRCAKCSHTFSLRLDQDEPRPLEAGASAAKGPRVLAVCNQKGGVAKTSTVMNLAAALARQGQRVLMVDFDMQASLSITLGYSNQARSFYDLVHGDSRLNDVITTTGHDNLWLLPANPNLALLAKKNVNKPRFEQILASRLQGVRGSIDTVIIDTPPSIEFFTLNALTAAQSVIIPSQCEYLAMHGVGHIIEAIETIKKLQGKELNYRILITLFQEENTVAQVIMKKMAERFAGHLFNTKINYDPKVQEAQILNRPLVAYDGAAPAAVQYSGLAREITEIGW